MKLKTLKTLLVESIITYLADRDSTIHINVDWELLDILHGSIDFPREAQNIVVNISAKAVSSFEAVDNKLIFRTSFRGVDTLCVVPTAAIHSVYNPADNAGMIFDPNNDLTEELKEIEAFSKKKTGQSMGTVTRLPERPSHLTVVK